MIVAGTKLVAEENTESMHDLRDESDMQWLINTATANKIWAATKWMTRQGKKKQKKKRLYIKVRVFIIKE